MPICLVDQIKSHPDADSPLFASIDLDWHSFASSLWRLISLNDPTCSPDFNIMSTLNRFDRGLGNSYCMMSAAKETPTARPCFCQSKL